MQVKRAAITGVASYLPDYILDNNELSKMMDTTDEWIMTRIGVKQRHIAKDLSMTASEMGALAVKKLLEKLSVKPEEIDILLCTTVTPDYPFPSTASIICGKCGIANAFAMDIKAACSGFLYALETVNAFIGTGKYKKIVVVSSEKMSWATDYTDRSTSPIFGDGAAAVMLEPTTEEVGVYDSVLKINGDGLHHLLFKGGGCAHPATHETVDAGLHYIYQEGKVVFKHAVEAMSEVAEEIMVRNGLDRNDVDWVVPHQANVRIIDATAKRIGIDKSKMMVNIETVGNTSSASIPICLAEYEEKLKKGDNLILAAFGAGFAWGGTYLKWAYDYK